MARAVSARAGHAGAIPRTPADGAVAPQPVALREAAAWFAVLGAPDVSPDDRLAWQRWHADCASHREAWARVEAIRGKFAGVSQAHQPAAHEVLSGAHRLAARRRTLRTLGTLGVAGAGVLGAGCWLPWAAWSASQRTAVGERREVRLADGGALWLGTATSVDVVYDTHWRRIVLHGGEIQIDTATDTVVPARDFVIDTAWGRLRALGTRFNVRQSREGIELAVFAGAVEIRPRAAGLAPVIVPAGQQVTLTRRGVSAPGVADPARQAWSRGLLVAEDLRLADLLAELSRHRRGYLGCAPAVADIRVVGTYALDDTDRVLAALTATLPIRLRAVSPWWVRVEPRG